MKARRPGAGQWGQQLRQGRQCPGASPPMARRSRTGVVASEQTDIQTTQADKRGHDNAAAAGRGERSVWRTSAMRGSRRKNRLP